MGGVEFMWWIVVSSATGRASMPGRFYFTLQGLKPPALAGQHYLA
jgi:hypothetical protein